MSEYARSLVWLGAFLVGVASTLTAVGFGYYFLQPTPIRASVGGLASVRSHWEGSRAFCGGKRAPYCASGSGAELRLSDAMVGLDRPTSVPLEVCLADFFFQISNR